MKKEKNVDLKDDKEKKNQVKKSSYSKKKKD